MSAIDQDGDIVPPPPPPPPPPGKAAETRIVKMDGRHKYVQWLLAVWDKQPGRPLPDLPDDYLGDMHDDSEPTRPSPDHALHRNLVLGSSCGWLATADDRGKIDLVNPATGEHHALPHIATTGVFVPSTGDRFFCVQLDRFLTARYGHGPPFKDSPWGPHGLATFTLRAKEMRAYFYQKVVLSTSPCPGSYAAMLILHRDFGAPAFVTAEEPAWRLAPSRDGVEDAIHQDGKFYSISYSGDVESWERDAESGAFTSTTAAPRLVIQDKAQASSSSCRKYLAAAPGGELMVVLKYPERCACYVLEDDGQWKETRDISDIPQFVGVNN
ncbi:uncharacterized protein [Triticum aestivum]|uniref:uncharacterized protein n=1 Tax=Triticum aestivum TaxID=4565 RepID=UPI001D021081|nr:uncharacterized protein LOC123149845 [Triticum aestivum]XP_044425524.1 uncharacterized protein LOC123149845 [Triticum aestivum]XP_044425525.1 uncharacterized protein LOC123149845 [Triticum aestivum]XP_044425526.1 uncharacterized protein LOC123149845 [Triticum aestivum]XP_044425527.1 uncharacterized protein LOC123149845 [Triticum aestivum]XP_044425528.1 uncharacterized protein LOC123149845 [Triticum aestivum]XP_044425529.1 uncharacterized protein LOC123149845 [Triticum aestivum]XP_04442553